VNQIDPRLKAYLNTAVKHKASDLHLQPLAKPHLRIEGKLKPIGNDLLSAEDSEVIILSAMDDKLKAALETNLEVDYALTIPNLGRFRVSSYMAQGCHEAVFRLVMPSPKTLQELRIPAIAEKLALQKDGLILVAGPTGSGKSSTLAGMIDIINESSSKRIITIENPVEILHTNKRSLITQRELGIDTNSFAGALRAVLRQDPDVIMVGEIRDKETADAALQAAQTGHLVLATIHAGNAEEAIIRLTNLFALEERDNIRSVLASLIRGVLVQNLVKDIKGDRLPLVEILINSSRMQDVISGEAKADTFLQVLEESDVHGMQTMDQHIIKLTLEKHLTPEVALEKARNKHFVQIQLKKVGML